MLERLIEATDTRDRRGHLHRANLGLTKLRHLLRLAHDLEYLDPRRYEHGTPSIDERQSLMADPLQPPTGGRPMSARQRNGFLPIAPVADL